MYIMHTPGIRKSVFERLFKVIHKTISRCFIQSKAKKCAITIEILGTRHHINQQPYICCIEKSESEKKESNRNAHRIIKLDFIS